jgi:hypothetical protein
MQLNAVIRVGCGRWYAGHGNGAGEQCFQVSSALHSDDFSST